MRFDKNKNEDKIFNLIKAGYCGEAIKLSHQLIDKLPEADCAYLYNLLGEAYMHTSEYPESIKNLYKSLSIAQKNQDQATQAKTYIVLSIVHIFIKNIKEAITLQLKALDIALKNDYKQLCITCYNNLAGIYGEAKDYERSLFYLKKVLPKGDLPEDESCKPVTVAALLNIGETYYHLKQPHIAEDYFYKAIEMGKKINTPRHIATAHMNLAALYKDKKDFDGAVTFGIEGLLKYRELGDKMQEAAACHQLSVLYEEAQNYINALDFIKQYIKLKEDILNDDIRKQLDLEKIKYQKREHEIQKEQAQKLLEMNEQLIQANNELLRANKEIRYLSIHDFLTDLLNRRGFEEAIETIVARCEQKNELYSLLLLDLDDFKTINDTYGHSVGDKVLIQLAGILKQEVGNSGIVGRFGGEEFVIAIPYTKVQEISHLANRLLVQVQSQQVELGSNTHISYTITIGISILETLNFDKHLHHADQNLYQGKTTTKNCVVI